MKSRRTDFDLNETGAAGPLGRALAMTIETAKKLAPPERLQQGLELLLASPPSSIKFTSA
jgi:hypothetical protein